MCIVINIGCIVIDRQYCCYCCWPIIIIVVVSSVIVDPDIYLLLVFIVYCWPYADGDCWWWPCYYDYLLLIWLIVVDVAGIHCWTVFIYVTPRPITCCCYCDYRQLIIWTVVVPLFIYYPNCWLLLRTSIVGGICWLTDPIWWFDIDLLLTGDLVIVDIEGYCCWRCYDCWLCEFWRLLFYW